VLALSVHLVLVLLASAGSATAATAVDAGASSVDEPKPSPARSLLPSGSPQRGGDPAVDYELRRTKDGTGDLIYEASGFTARVARDGSVSFHDKHLSGLGLLFIPKIRAAPPPIGVPSLESVLRGHGQRTDPPPVSAAEQAALYGSRLPIPTVSPYRPDPREACQYPQPCFFNAPVLLLSATGHFDLTDELMRLGGQDPYRFAKARFLGATSELRIRMAARAHGEDLRDSIAKLPEHLTTISCDERLSIVERRAIVEGLRAELDSSAPEAQAVDAQIARFLIDYFDRSDGGSPCPVR
jgi:hypothetical protein